MLQQRLDEMDQLQREDYHYIGTAYRGTTVYASFDPVDCEWIFRDDRGTELRTRLAEEMTEANLLALQVSGQHGKTQKSK